MLLNLVLFSSIMLVPSVLAVPSATGLRVARRREGRQSQLSSHLTEYNDAASNTEYSSNWAGAVSTEGDGTFTSVTGSFTVPTPSGAQGTSAAAWVGIDGYTCESAILQTGVDFTVSSDGPTYDAWYEWFPAPGAYFTGIKISAGDIIKLNVTASSKFSGTATIENLTNGQVVSQSLTSDAALCGQNAEWIVEDYMRGESQVPFADFGTVTFTNAEGTGSGSYTPSDAILIDIKQNDQILTSTSVSGSSVTIKYV